ATAAAGAYCGAAEAVCARGCRCDDTEGTVHAGECWEPECGKGGYRGRWPGALFFACDDSLRSRRRLTGILEAHWTVCVSEVSTGAVPFPANQRAGSDRAAGAAAVSGERP